jgi:hypothetical protein
MSSPPHGDETIQDPVLVGLVAESRADADTLGLLLHGSRAVDRHRADSDYDLIRIVSEPAFRARAERDALLERMTPSGQPKVETLYQTPARIEPYVSQPDWYTATYLSARILFDRTGEVGALLARMRAEAGRIANERTAAAYDDYLNSYVRSLKAARRGDDLGRRLHSAHAASSLVSTLFGLESEWPPYHDGLAAALPQLEARQGWPDGYLADALIRLVRDADPTFQQKLETRVETLMTARGVPHQWEGELDELRALRFEHGSVTHE